MSHGHWVYSTSPGLNSTGERTIRHCQFFLITSECHEMDAQGLASSRCIAIHGCIKQFDVLPKYADRVSAPSGRGNRTITQSRQAYQRLSFVEKAFAVVFDRSRPLNEAVHFDITGLRNIMSLLESIPLSRESVDCRAHRSCAAQHSLTDSVSLFLLLLGVHRK